MQHRVPFRFRAYAIMGMMYAWLDKEVQFARHLKQAKKLVQLMDDNPDGEEVPLVRDGDSGGGCAYRRRCYSSGWDADSGGGGGLFDNTHAIAIR